MNRMLVARYVGATFVIGLAVESLLFNENFGDALATAVLAALATGGLLIAVERVREWKGERRAEVVGAIAAVMLLGLGVVVSLLR